MRTVRILISSPLDVAEERQKARLVIESLERYYERLAKIEVVMFEDLATSVDESVQESIAKVLSEKSGINIAVFILWSRLGSELSEEKTPKAGGGVYRSGTEHEFDLMLAARRQSGGKQPDILAYWRQDEKSFVESLKNVSPNDYAKLLEQREMARRFIEERFMDEKGRNIAGLCMFAEPVSFAQRLDRHLRERLDKLLAAALADSASAVDIFRKLRQTWFSDFLHEYGGKLDSRMDSLANDPDFSADRLHGRTDFNLSDNIFDDLTEAYRRLRFNHQYDYSTYKLSTSIDHPPWQFLKWPLLRQQSTIQTAVSLSFVTAFLSSIAVILTRFFGLQRCRSPLDLPYFGNGDSRNRVSDSAGRSGNWQRY